MQGDLEAALFVHTGVVDTFVAGRTDKGVHAAGQVVSFSTDDDIDRDRVMRSLNRQLSPEIAIQALEPAAEGFHARFSATGRSYRYLVLARSAPDPFLARTSWHCPQPLDIDAMNEAAVYFAGEQDFASLCRKAGDASTVRKVRTALWAELEEGLLEYRVEASSFCHQMVRSMVSVSIDVGRRRIAAAQVPAILAARDRNAARGAAPPHGLTLVSVSYD